MSSVAYRQVLLDLLQPLSGDNEIQQLWSCPWITYSAAAVEACRTAIATGQYQLLQALPAGNGQSDNIILLFFQTSQRLAAALVLDPYELWADMKVLDVADAKCLPNKAEVVPNN